MKTYILTAELKVTDESIAKARKWAKRKRYDYKDDVAHLLFDCIADGEDIGYEIEKTELDDFKETKNNFKKLLAEVKQS